MNTIDNRRVFGMHNINKKQRADDEFIQSELYTRRGKAN